MFKQLQLVGHQQHRVNRYGQIPDQDNNWKKDKNYNVSRTLDGMYGHFESDHFSLRPITLIHSFIHLSIHTSIHPSNQPSIILPIHPTTHAIMTLDIKAILLWWHWSIFVKLTYFITLIYFMTLVYLYDIDLLLNVILYQHSVFWSHPSTYLTVVTLTYFKLVCIYISISIFLIL